ncbi:superoxide dismutase [Deinococcus psychrotolerans]|uniref:Superoxide dismutase n=1 Tax=Deinococcus psychrotolerans TaxID=2489213 RepID=A0A3G8YL04_9DEIO|nr:superoxide dismutase [Deinococcus psychrotolerans]AZI41766.1 superoxide dismutase [Deinococcus psychrotolerans]
MKNTMMFGMGVLLLSSCSMMGMGAGSKDSTMTKDGAAMKDNSMADSSMAVKTPVVNQNTASYVLNRQPAATNIAPMGNVAVTMNGDTVMTTTKLTGMAPETYYVAHYHEQGTVPSTDPCASNGPAILPSMMVGLSDKGGNVILMGSVAKSAIMKATYYNVHTAKNAAGEPADPGVACSAVKM